MSVINQMLVDLERRRASGEERNRIPNHVRALPGSYRGTDNRALLIVAAIALVALAAGAWWWFARPSTPAVPVPTAATPATVAPAAPVAAPVADQAAVEMIAQRMSLELAHVPEILAAEPEKHVRAGLTTAAVMSPATVPPAPAKPADNSKDAQKAARTPPPAAAEKPLAPPRVEIDKRVREPTARQRADAEYAKGTTALQQGRPGDAGAALEAALQLDPLHHSARQALIGVLLNRGQQDEVLRLLQEGLQLAPAQFGFAMALARLQVERGELDAAVQTLARSLGYAGSNADYIAFYAGLLQRQQKHAEAVEQFQRALQLRGNAGVWLLGIGVSLEALGRGAEAKEAYRRAQASGNLSADLQAFAEQRLR